MSKKKLRPLITVDIAFRFRGAAYCLRLSDILKWILPAAVIAYRLFRVIHLLDGR